MRLERLVKRERNDCFTWRPHCFDCRLCSRYGGWLAKQWGVDPKRSTPAQELEDGIDYVPSKPYVLLGHHFSSIAGAGPINGPIQAAVFGWVPVLLWVLIRRIFFGAMHDFGALFASFATKDRVLQLLLQKISTTPQSVFSAFLLTLHYSS